MSDANTGRLVEDHTTIASGDLDDDESYSDDEDSQSESDSDDDDSETDEEEMEEPDDDNRSHLVPVIPVGGKKPIPRTEEQHIRQKRIVDMASSATFSSDDEDDDDEEGASTVYSSQRSSYGGTNATTTDDDRGGGATTQEDEDDYYDDAATGITTAGGGGNGTMTTGGAYSSSHSVASQGSSTTQPTSPGRPFHTKKVSQLLSTSDRHIMMDEDSHNSILTDAVDSRSPTHISSGRNNRLLVRKNEDPRSNRQQHPNKNNNPPPMSPSRYHHHHERVPGGAAAKLMLLGPKGSKESEDSNNNTGSNNRMGGGGEIEQMSSTESLIKVDPGDLLVAERQRAKEEFCTVKSPSKKNRFQPPSPLCGDTSSTVENNNTTGTNTMMDDSVSDVQTQVSTTPSFLNRSEIFHNTASAAVAALLQPLRYGGAPADAAPPESFFPSTMSHGGSPSRSSLRQTNIKHASDFSSASSTTITPIMANHHPGGSGGGTGQSVEPPVSTVLLSKETELKLEAMQSRMINPTPTLTDLLTAIASAPDSSTEGGATFDSLGYAVRRKNACGALQTLTANSTNRVRICWTAGVLPALTSVLSDGLLVVGGNGDEPSDAKKSIFLQDGRIRTEYEAARHRAISTLMNLCIPVKNRLAVFHSPSLVHTVLKTVEQDHGLARKGCCAVLAYLAKSSENRLLLAQVPGLMDVLRKVLKPRPPRVELVATPLKEKKIYPWSDGDEASSSSGSHPNGTEKAKKADRNSFMSSNASDKSYDDSGDTPKVEGIQSPREISGYDETADELLQAARQNLFAMVGHLVKEKDNAYHFARDLNLLTTMVEVSRFQESPSHALAVKVLAHLTRHRLNKVLAFKPKIVVPALVEATQSPNDDARLFACYALQNLSQEKSCRQELAIAAHLIESLCDRCRNVDANTEERLAAISTLKNLCDEPANLIPMTNTTGCVSTLMYLAHTSPQSASPSNTTSMELIQFRACDALATLSHWLRKIATSGHSLAATHKGRQPTKGLFVPSLREVSWNQWT